MRACLALLPALGLVLVAALGGCESVQRETARVEGLTATAPGAFLYSAQTNTVMTENDDGAAERIRRDWLADAVQANGMCRDGYVVDTRRFIADAAGRFGNGGWILYGGRCL